MKNIFHPRDFQFTKMPENWRKIDFCKDYCEWLIDYLLTIDKPIPDFQKATWELLDSQDLTVAAKELGKLTCQHNLYYVEPYDDEGKLPESYEVAYEVMQEEHLQSMRGLEGELYEPLESWINPEIWANLEREFKEYGKVISEAPDIGYRVILSKLVKKATDRKQQSQIIREFYQGFLHEKL